MESEAVSRSPTPAQPGQEGGGQRGGLAPLSLSQPPPLVPLSLSAPPRLLRTAGRSHSPAASSDRSSESSDSSDSSAGCSPIGGEPGYQRFYSRSQSATNSSSESDAASPIKSPRLEGRQTSVFSWSPSPPEESPSLARYKQNVRRRLAYLYRQMSPQNLDDTTDSEVRPILAAEQESFEGTTDTDTGAASASGDTQAIADGSCRAELGMTSADAEHLGGTVTEKVYTELMPMQLEPVEHDADLLLNAEESALPVETGTAEPAMSQLAELVLTDGATSRSVQSPAADASVGSATPQLRELLPADMATSQTVQSAMATNTVGSAVTHLVELGQPGGATWQSAHPSNSFPLNLISTNGSINPTAPWLPTPCVQFVGPTPSLMNQTPGAVQNASVWAVGSATPVSNATVGSSVPHMVQLIPTQPATWQSAHSSNSFPFNILPPNQALTQMVSWLPVTPCVQFVVPTAPLIYQLPGAQQNAILYSVGSVPMTATTDLLTGSPYGVNPTSSVQSGALLDLQTPITEVADVGNPYSIDISVSPTISEAETAAAGSAMTGVQRSAPTTETSSSLSQGSRDSSPVTTPADLSIISATQSSTGTNTSPTLGMSMLSSLPEFRASTAAKTAPTATRSSTGTNTSPTLEMSMLSNLSEIRASTAPKTAPTGTRSSTGTNTSPTLEMSMLSNLSEFRASTAPKTAPKMVQTKILSYVRDRAPVFSSGMKDSSSAATRQDKTIGSEQTTHRPKLTVKKTTATVKLLECPKLMLKTTDTSVIPGRPILPNKKTSALVQAPGRSTRTDNLTGFSSDPRPSSSVDVSMLSNVGEFSASTGAQQGVGKTTKDTVLPSTTRGKRAAAKTGVRKNKEL